MSRELRRVAKDWNHPLYRVPLWRSEKSEILFRPLLQAPPGLAAQALAEYVAERTEYDLPCIRTIDDWMPDWPEAERTHLQIYETIGEGTPVSPVCAGKDDLLFWMTQPLDRSSLYNGTVDWLCMQGLTLDVARRWLEAEGSVGSVKIDGAWMTGVEAAGL